MPTDSNQKIELLLQAALDADEEELADSPDLSAGYHSTDRSWEVIVKYTGSLESLREEKSDIRIVELYQEYAILRLPQSEIERVASRPEIIYMEKPKRLYFENSKSNDKESGQLW